MLGGLWLSGRTELFHRSLADNRTSGELSGETSLQGELWSCSQFRRREMMRPRPELCERQVQGLVKAGICQSEYIVFNGKLSLC